MAGPTLVGSAFTSANNTATVTSPAGTALGDLIVIEAESTLSQVFSDVLYNSNSASAGFTASPGSPVSNGTNNRVWRYAKLATAGDVGAITYAASGWVTGQQSRIQVRVFRHASGWQAVSAAVAANQVTAATVSLSTTDFPGPCVALVNISVASPTGAITPNWDSGGAGTADNTATQNDQGDYHLYDTGVTGQGVTWTQDPTKAKAVLLTAYAVIQTVQSPGKGPNVQKAKGTGLVVTPVRRAGKAALAQAAKVLGGTITFPNRRAVPGKAANVQRAKATGLLHRFNKAPLVGGAGAGGLVIAARSGKAALVQAVKTSAPVLRHKPGKAALVQRVKGKAAVLLGRRGKASGVEAARNDVIPTVPGLATVTAAPALTADVTLVALLTVDVTTSDTLTVDVE